jgi:hypothetical protein
MATEHDASDKPVFELNLSDPDLKKRVMECIQKQGKLSFYAKPAGAQAQAPGGGGYTRID